MAINPSLLGSSGASDQPQQAPAITPGQPTILFEAGPFKGLDTWRSPLQMQPNYMTTLSFMTLDDTLMSIVTDKGRQDLFTGFSTPLGFDIFYPATGGQAYGFLVQGANWKQIDYIGNTAPVTVTLPYAWNSQAQTYFATIKNIIVAANGINQPVKIRDDWNPAAPVATQMGIATPATAVSTSGGTAGNLNGTYSWRITFSSSLTNGHESSPGPFSINLTVTNQNVNIVNIPTSSDPQVDQRNIYRIGGSVPEWRLVGTINDNTTTTANDNVSDLNLGILMTFDRDLPPVGLTQLIQHKNRLWGFIGNSIYGSNYNEPEGWPPTLAMPIGRADNIIGLGTTGSVLLIFKRGQVWGLLGESLSDFALVKLYDVGALSTRGIVSVANEVFWLSEDGFRAASGGSTTQAPGIRMVGANIWNIVRDLPAAAKKTCVMSYGNGKVTCSFPDAATPIMYFLDLKVGDWEREKNPMQQMWGFPRMGEWCTAPIGMRQVVAAFNAGDPGQFIFTEYTAGGPGFSVRGWPNVSNTPYQDLGGNMSWQLERKQWDGGLGVLVKRYREVEIVAPRQNGAKIILTLTCDDDTAKKQYVKTLDMTYAPLRFGLPPNMNGAYITVNISGQTQQRIQIDRVRIKGWVEHPYARDGSK